MRTLLAPYPLVRTLPAPLELRSSSQFWLRRALPLAALVFELRSNWRSKALLVLELRSPPALQPGSRPIPDISPLASMLHSAGGEGSRR